MNTNVTYKQKKDYHTHKRDTHRQKRDRHMNDRHRRKIFEKFCLPNSLILKENFFFLKNVNETHTK